MVGELERLGEPRAIDVLEGIAHAVRRNAEAVDDIQFAIRRMRKAVEAVSEGRERLEAVADINSVWLGLAPLSDTPDNAPFFTSARERRLWVWALALVAAIYSTLGLAGTLAVQLREHRLATVAFFLLMALTVAAIVGSGLKRRPGARDVWVALGVAAVLGMTALRMGVTPEERTHLMEYSVVAVLIYQALCERAENGRRVPAPAVLALVATVAVGWLDEGVQAALPNRVYDNLDVFRNTVAAVVGIVTSVAIGWVHAALERRGVGGGGGG